ncbi:DUF1338 domain-containing protein [Flammeovirga yaeyamensis]|uniref:2-oxoadipate dioxygenase/decarboxylase n=1 Tax=Flammeovirga yaeyamensis TaxID=367791 RepID=A0AAX1N846_9BACT|nr:MULTISPECIES: DUF1338 domain-containing protein [Flammeovirga]ANQ48869.1 DUF1338 domain-containing protein [Flammeovirga sp. MY04]MBB3698950.1 hypothetical protein [Flammeovirga yaeyamensis]NMF36384.1 DUF1338 domain-containing protein [Flammeovirga yaeyamensis]QWG03655.1 DUF1338 domain-containing protein [Flammeovirga yaeyamensis]
MKNIIDLLWQKYINVTPSAAKIHDIFKKKGEKNIANDHIAIRTFNHDLVNKEKLAEPFLAMGYEKKGDYIFEAKKLKAIHLEHRIDKDMPKIFISELRLELCSEFLQEVADTCVEISQIPHYSSEDLLLQGRTWGTPSHKIYEKLLAESEYAAWMYVYGFRANHFTVYVNKLENFDTLESVNDFLKDNGFPMNTSGGEIKGSKEQLLEQSSILADKTKVNFIEGEYEIPSCYYEFAKRYELKDGQLFEGFIASSADKIFESTDVATA